jgi:hypothetical protein
MERDPPPAGVDGAYKVLNAFNTVVAARAPRFLGFKLGFLNEYPNRCPM